MSVIVMEVFLRFIVFAFMKLSRYFVYPTYVEWISSKPEGRDWDDINLVLVLNHTSLFEPILITALPFRYIWNLSRNMLFPAAEETLRKPIMGRVLKFLGPQVVSLSRRRDESWNRFMNAIRSDLSVIYFPEGRMKRQNGLDKDGMPMTVRGGVLDVLRVYEGQKVLLAYSHGLHHIMPPGRNIPKLFKRIDLKMEVMLADELLGQVKDLPDEKQRKAHLAKILETKRDRHCV